MPKTSQRNKSKARKHKRTVKHLTMQYHARKKSKHLCNACSKVMHGMPHTKTTSQVRKLSKTQKRPTSIFSGTLCNNCRTLVIEEAVKVKYEIKNLAQVNLLFKPFVEHALTKIE